MAVGLHSISKDDAKLIRNSGNTMKSKTLAAKSILGMAENWAKWCQLRGHSMVHLHATEPHLETMRVCYFRWLVTIKQ